MAELREVKKRELKEMHTVDQKYVGNDDSFRKFRKRYQKWPETFLVCVEDGEIMGFATGRMEGEDGMGLESIGVKEEYRERGIGSQILELFEEKAEKYADAVTVASADNTEDFYRSNGYSPAKILLQVEKEDLPEGYSGDRRIKEEKDIDNETKFLYAGFEDYSEELRDSLKEDFNAFEVNTIYQKEL